MPTSMITKMKPGCNGHAATANSRFTFPERKMWTAPIPKRPSDDPEVSAFFRMPEPEQDASIRKGIQPKPKSALDCLLEEYSDPKKGLALACIMAKFLEKQSEFPFPIQVYP